MTVTDQSLQALASLLETERNVSVAVMIEQMRSFSDAELERLGTLAAPHSPAQAHIDLILAEKRSPRMQAAFLAWLARGAPLEEGVLLVARAGYPRLNVEAVRQDLDRLTADIRPRILSGSEAGRLTRMSEILREEYGFHGNVEDYYDPDNSYVHRALERRTGLPLTLTVIYMLIGRRLGLAIAGIPLPAHFIGALATTASTVYFDPFHDGQTLSLRDVMRLVNQAGQVFHTDLLRSATSRQIVERMLANLIHGYQEREEPERAELMRRYLAVL